MPETETSFTRASRRHKVCLTQQSVPNYETHHPAGCLDGRAHAHERRAVRPFNLRARRGRGDDAL